MAATSDTDDSDDEVPTHLVTAPVMLLNGLRLMGYQDRRIGRAKDKTNQERFLHHLGVEAATACAIHEDMQLTTIEAARINGNELTLKWFLLGLYYLRKYPKEVDIESKFDYSKYWGRAGCWDMARKIRAMKAQKIFWPDGLGASDTRFYRCYLFAPLRF